MCIYIYIHIGDCTRNFIYTCILDIDQSWSILESLNQRGRTVCKRFIKHGTGSSAFIGFRAKTMTRPWQKPIQCPIESMYGIYGNIYHQYTPNVSIYTIHGSYGCWKCSGVNTFGLHPLALIPWHLGASDALPMSSLSSSSTRQGLAFSC